VKDLGKKPRCYLSSGPLENAWGEGRLCKEGKEKSLALKTNGRRRGRRQPLFNWESLSRPGQRAHPPAPEKSKTVEKKGILGGRRVEPHTTGLAKARMKKRREILNKKKLFRYDL